MEYQGPLTIPVARQSADVKAEFITKVYGHLLAMVGLFVAIEVALFTSGIAEPIYETFAGGSWLLVLGGFMIASHFATKAAHRIDSVGLQYAGLVGVTLAYALLFVPILYVANVNYPGVTSSAATITLLMFAGLTAIVWKTKANFEGMGRYLMLTGIAAIVLIVASLLFGFELGVWFSVAMIAYSCGSILYSTDKVLNRYPPSGYVGAATELFASVAILFFYVMRLLMALRR